MALKRGSAQTGLDKKALIGCIVIAEEEDFEKSLQTSYGETAAWTGDVIVVTGDLAGTKHRGVRFFGVMASQLHGQTRDGDKVVLKVTSGKASKPGMSDWVGVTHDITDEEFDKASEVMAGMEPEKRTINEGAF